MGESPKNSNKNTKHNSNLGVANASLHIINGVRAASPSYRYFARLTFLSNGRLHYHCGGVLISERVVLTAASCVWDYDANRVRDDAYGASIGYKCDERDNCGQPFVSFQAITYWVHPLWREQQAAMLDLALFDLASPVPSDVAIPAEPDTGEHLGSLSFGYADGLKSVGYGHIDDDGTLPTALQEINVGFMPDTVCEEFWGPLHNTAVCVYTNDAQAGLFGRGLCFGDSGGPTVIRHPLGADVVVGITSFGSTPCEEKTRPDVLARVSAGIDFIATVSCARSRAPWCNNVNCGSFLGGDFLDAGEINFIDAGGGGGGAVPVSTTTATTTSSCQEHGKTKFHPDLTGRPRRTKKCRKLRTKSRAQKDKICSKTNSDVWQQCCQTCQGYGCNYF